MAATIDGQNIRLESVHRFGNDLAECDGHLRWNLTGVYEHVLTGLALVPDALSIGIDTWGVDYGLLDGDGVLIAEPIAYRDDRTTKVIDDVHALVSPSELYAINGLQFL